jgi:hypothetical protein
LNRNTAIFYFLNFFYFYWLRHNVTSRKAAGSRPDEVNDIFQIT